MTGWRKSSYCSAADTCVMVDITPDAVLVREDSISSETLEFTHDEWRAFLAGVAAGEFDLVRSEVEAEAEATEHGEDGAALIVQAGGRTWVHHPGAADLDTGGGNHTGGQ